ncbi:glycosyltransferase [Sporosarcina sp. P7]|nr:glycosyltransferase [Sporosarcina sp. P7]PID01953.1 glycosyl transferase family 1 [Sporosarcina sp. P2]PID24321.1 glycosyl transferase family 1 [Sporosarcina sp. P7]
MVRKVLFISDHGDPLAPLGSEQAGGQNNYVRQLALALESEGYAVDVVTHWNSLDTPQVERFGTACRVIRIAAGKHYFVQKNEMYRLIPAFFDEMSKTLNFKDYDVVHTHYWLSGLVGSFIKQKWGIPWIHTNHSLGMAKRKATGNTEALRLLTEKMILTSADLIVVTTQSEKQLIREFIDNPAPMKVIPIGVDKAFQANKPKLVVSPYFAFAGRLQTTKGIYTLLKAFELFIKDRPSTDRTKLIIAGGSESCISPTNHLPKSPKLRMAIEGFNHKVEFLGPQNQQQLARLFTNSIATIVPSYYESFGMVAAEAQACGSPVIASKVGGLQNIIMHGMTGLHVEHNNPFQLSQVMSTLLDKPHFTKKLGQRAAAYAREEFDWRVIAYKMARAYKGVANETKIVLAGD